MNVQSILAVTPALGLAGVSLATWGTIVGLVAGGLSIAYTLYRWINDVKKGRRK